MKNVFTGFVFIILNFSLKLGSSKIGLIPDFIGYLIMVKGLNEMARESASFMKVKPYASGMALYTGLLYFLDLIGVSWSLGVFSYILVFTAVVITLYISYHIVLGVSDMERTYHRFLYGKKLKSVWSLYAAFDLFSFMSLLLPPVITIMCIISTMITSIGYLIAFNHSKNLYYKTVR